MPQRSESKEVDVEPRRDITLKDVMRPPVSVPPDAPAREALRALKENGVESVLVVGEDGKLEGYIGAWHLLHEAMPKYFDMMDNLSMVPESADDWVKYIVKTADKPVREIMNSEVSSVDLSRSELAAAHIMLHEKVSSVAITDNEEVVGIVSLLDLYSALVGIE